MSKLPKSDYYVKELDAARLRGDWLVQNPCNDQTGKPISWPELIRKYMKHNPGNHAAPTIAVSEHELRSSLLAYYDDIKYTDASQAADFALPVSQHSQPSSQGQTAQPKPLTRSHNGVGWSTEAISDIAKRLRESADASSRDREDDVQRYGIISLEALALWSLGRDSEAADRIKTSGFFDSQAIESLKSDGHYSDYNVALVLTGATVYGLANERLYTTRPSEELAQQALVGYARAIDLHEAVRGGRRAHAMRGLPADEIERWGERALYHNALLTIRECDSSAALNALRAYQAHVSRWPADFRQTQRNVIYKSHLAALNRTARQGNYVEPTPASSSTTSLPSWREKTYNRQSIIPAASRFQLHGFTADTSAKANGGGLLTLSGLEAGTPSVKARTVSSRRPNPHLLHRPTTSAWGAEFLVVQRAAISSLERATDFPRAGEVNPVALDFAEELTAGWKINGEHGGEVADEIVEVLYKLSTLTFHSQRISRHLFTVLVGAERYQEAARALKLYIQIVDKAKEADAAEAASMAKEVKDSTGPSNANGTPRETLPRRSSLSRKTSVNGRAANGSASSPNGTNGSLGRRVSFDQSPEPAPAQSKGKKDDDSFPTYVRILLTGARVHTRYLNGASHGDKLARKALEIVTSDAHKAEFTTAKELVALTYRIAGYTRAAVSSKESDRVRRPELQQEALNLLETSAQLDPNASETYFQLAYVQAEKRDIRAAVFSARKALELEPADVDAWHLLVLILSSQKDFKAALDLAEVALGEAETDDAADDLDGTVATSNQGPGNASVANGAAPIISRSTLLSFDFPPKPIERSHSILRLMVTHNILQEMVEGIDAAIEGQRNLFEFFHERVSTGAIAATALPLGNSEKGAEPRAAQFGNTGRFSTFLHPTQGKGTVRSNSSRESVLGSPTGSNGLARSLSHLSNNIPSNFSPTRARSIYSNLRGGHGVSPTAAPTATVSEEDVDISDGAAVRLFLYSKIETSTLVSLWLLSAATFRRAKKLSQSRAAIQEAERLAPGSADVWVQLALYFNERNDISLAINTLYKALACAGNHVAASVHLARLFLSYPTKIPGTAQDAAAVIENAKTTSAVRGEDVQKIAAKQEKAGGLEEKSAFEPSKAAASSADVAQSLMTGSKKGGEQQHFASAADATTSTLAKEVSATSLAEGLLTSVTATNGWDVPEAWLFLSQVAQRTDRSPRAREYLQYALGLEDTKPVRPLDVALSRVAA